jgi:type II secretory ATPase GspE/PulE/Tfp pilus assembly ATPase PilB-like protein
VGYEPNGTGTTDVVADVRSRVIPMPRNTMQHMENEQSDAAALVDLIVSTTGVERRIADAAFVEHEMTGEAFLDVLSRWSAISSDQVLAALALHHKLTVVDLRTGPPLPPAGTSISADDCRRLSCVPLDFDGDVLHIATAHPTPELVAELRELTGYQIKLHVASEAEIAASIRSRDITDIAFNGASVDPAGAIIRVARFLGASTARFELTSATTTSLRLRIDGVWRVVCVLNAEFTSSLKRTFHSQNAAHPDGDFSVSTHTTGSGESISISIASRGWSQTIVMEVPHIGVRALDDLGFSTEIVSAIRDHLERYNGMVVVAGPVDSGVPTTVRAILDEIDPDERLVSVISSDHSTQSTGCLRIHAGAEDDVLAALSHARMAQADVIALTDVVAPSVATSVRQLSNEGRLVIAGMRIANDDVVSAALTRFNLTRDDLASEAVLIVGQRLVRRVCGACSTAFHPSDAERMAWAELGGSSSTTFIHGVGCNVCADTGFDGRVAIVELASPAGSSRSGTRTAPLVSSAVALVEQRQTTLSELLRSFTLRTSTIAS